MSESLLSHPYLGLILSIAAYGIAVWIRAKTQWSVANPLLVSATLVILVIHYTPLSLEHYRKGGSVVTMLIVPATTVLAIQINRQWAALRANVVPVLGGCIAGCFASLASIWLLCRFFGINETVTASLLPKSVTTAISIELSEKTGGMPSLTVSAVILTGMASAILSPLIMRLLRLNDRVGNGIAIGVSGHAVGTAKALEMGETEGAFSGIALGLSGIVTSIIYATGLMNM